MKKIKVAAILIAGTVLAAGITAACSRSNSDSILKDEISVSNGNRIIQEKGFVLQAWLPSEKSGEKQIDFDRIEALGFGPTYYDGNLFNTPIHEKNEGILWSLAKAPNNGNSLETSPDGKEWMSEEQLKYADDLISVCFGDEQEYSKEQTQLLASCFEDFRSRNNNVLLHSNQWAGQWKEKEYEEYMKIAKPDILTYDSYYFDQLGSNKDYNVASIIADDINAIRIPAMKGYDGSGSSPIPFGQYLLGYKTGDRAADVGWYEVTESQKKLVANLTVTMGGKWLNLFRIIDSQQFLFFDENGNPTRHFEDYCNITKTINTLSPHLVNLQTEDVEVLSGKHKLGFLTLNNKKPSTINRFNGKNSFGITDITAENLGSENNSLPGDVYIGYFRTLPGNDEMQNRKYFIVCNALTSGNGLKPEEQKGSSAETAQKITIKTEENSKSLYAVNIQTGKGEKVNVVNEEYSFELGGGDLQVFYFE